MAERDGCDNIRPSRQCGEFVRKKESDIMEPIFQSFLSSKKRKELDLAFHALHLGLSDLTLGILFVESSNAYDIASFKDSSIQTSPLSLDKESKVAKGAVAGDVFLIGVDVLQNYLDKRQPKIPENVLLRKALQKLLIFLTSSEDHSVLFGGKDSEAKWTVTLAQHLLSQLAVNSRYTIDTYPGLQGTTKCPCKDNDELDGRVGDTSYGCLKGWHGKVDIMMEDLPVSVFQGDSEDNDDDNDDVDDCDVKYEDHSTSLVKVKASDNFSKKDVNQILAQTIVFSFLQHKLKKGKLNNYLIPGVGITWKYLMVCLFDTENDVLLESKPIELFEGKSIRTLAVLFLWLTLNYRLFCSGITQEMIDKQSDFIRKLGDKLHVYKDEVSRPVHVPQVLYQELYPWAKEPVLSEFRTSPSLIYRNLPLNTCTDDDGGSNTN